MHFIDNTNDMSTTAFGITPTKMITNHNNNEQCTAVLLNSNERTEMKTTNVNDGRQNQRDREKGKREEREDYVERKRQTNKNTDSVTSFANKQYNCSSVKTSMANYFSSTYERNNIFLSNNHSTTRRAREYQPSYPSITRFHTSLSCSPYRKTHYLDDSDEEIINDEIIEIIDLDHYPTLIERWGEDTKPIIRQHGEFKIEDYVEFEEIEPTITEEISYEIIYEGDQIKSTREIHHSRSESRNFRKIKKRRTKRKRTQNNTSFSQHNDSSIENIITSRTNEIPHSITNGIQSTNIDEGISSRTLLSNDQEKNLFELIEQDRNQSYVSSNDISSRIESSINDSNDIDSDESILSDQINNEIEVTFDEQQNSPVTTASVDHQSLETTAAHDILTTTLPLDLPAIDIKTETVEQNVEKPSIYSVVETIPLIVPSSTNDTPVQYTYEDEKQSVSINKSESTPTIVPSDLPSIEIKTETVYTEEPNDEKSSNYFITEVDKQPEAIITPITTITTPEKELCQQTDSSRNQFMTSNSVNQTVDTILSDKQKQQQSSIPLKTEEDEHVALSSDFPADIVRQIRTTAATNNLPSIDHTEQLLEKSIEDSSTIIAEQPDIEDNEQSETTTLVSTPNLVSLETSIPSETDFSDFYQDRYFPFTTNEQTFSNLTSLEDERLDEKKAAPDLTQIYYELHEQRHIQPVLDNTLTEEKQETSDINLDNQIAHFDIKSFPIMTNLPSKEYHQVFGVSDEIIDTVADLIDNVNQTVLSNISNEESQIKETFTDRQSIVPVEQKEPINEITPSTTSNVELDLRYSLLLDRMNTLLQPLMSLSSSSFVTDPKTMPTNVIDQVTTMGTDVSNEIVIPPEANSEAAVSKSSEENTSNVKDEEQKQAEYQMELSPSISSEGYTPNADEYQKIVDSSNVTDHIKSLVTTDISNITNALPTSTFIEQASTINEMTVADSEVQSPIVTDEEIETKEVDNQQQSSSTGLFEIVQNLFTPTLQSNTPIETSLPNVPSEQQDIIESPVDNFNLSSTDTNQQTSLQASITDEKESHGIFDLVVTGISNIKETISNLGSSGEKAAVSTSVPEIVTDTAPSYQELQVINDDYPWYSSYYSIVDAEARFAQSCKQLNLSNEQSPPLTKAEVQSGTIQNNELQDKGDTDDNGFHIVQHRKRIPSSTTHEKTVASTVITSKPAPSPDIDLEPVILHGHPSASLPVSPIVPQTTDTTAKKKQKKKKKDKTEMIVFNAPEPTLSHVSQPTIDLAQSQIVEEEQGQENIEMNDTLITEQTLKHKRDETSSSIIDQVTTMVTDIPANIVNDSSLVTSNEAVGITHDTDVSNEILSLPEANSEDAVSKSSEENTSNAKYDEQKQAEHHTELSPSVSSEDCTASANEYQKVADSSNVTDHIESPVTTVISNVTNALPTSTSIEQASTINEMTVADSEVQSPIVTDEEIETKEVDNQQQSSSTGLFEILQNLFTPALQSNTPIETSLESVPSEQQDNIESPVDNFNLSTIDTNQQTSLQASITDEKESHGVFDLVASAISNIKETISNLGSADEKTAVLTNVPDVLNDTTKQLNDLDHVKEQPMSIDNTVEEMNHDAHEKITSTQEQVAEISRQSINFNYPSSSDQYKAAATELDRLSSTHQPSTIDHKQEDENEKKSSYQKLQVINDDYPWYSSHFSIVDAEARFARLYKQLNLSNEQSPPLTKVEFQSGITQNNELQDKEDTDDNGFHIVQRRKRIPSSTTPEKTAMSTVITTNPALSPDIDLEPVVLHGHPSASLPVSPIIPQTTDTTAKKNQKKKKKDKKEMILFNAPEPTSSHVSGPTIDLTQSQTVQVQQGQESMEMNDTLITDQILKHKEEQDSSSIIDQVTTTVSGVPANIPRDSSLTIANQQINTAHHADLAKEKEISTTLDQITSTTQSVADNNKILTLPEGHSEVVFLKSSEEDAPKAEDDKQEQVAHQTKLYPAISSEEHIVTDEHQEIVDSSNVTDHIKSFVTTVMSNLTSALPTLTSIEQASTTTEMTVADSEVQSPIVTDEEIETKEVDNQQQSSSTGLFEILQNLFPSTLQSNTGITTSLETVPSKQHGTVENLVDNFHFSSTATNQQTSLQASIPDEKESHGVFDLVVTAISNIKETISNLGSSGEKTAVSTSVPDMVNDTAPSYQELQVINDDYPWYSSYYSIVDAEARFAQSCKQLNLSNEQPLPLTKVEVQSGTTQNNELQDKQDTDDNGFQIVQHRKRIPSSTTHEKTAVSTVITSKPVVSPDIDLESVILHGHPSAPLPVSPIIPQTTDTTAKKKQKKKKKDKTEMILFTAPEPTIDLTQSQTVEEEQGQENIEMNDTVNIDQTLKHKGEQSSSNVIDQVTAMVTDVPANIVIDSPSMTPNEEIGITHDIDVPNEILTLPEANSEAAVSKASEENTSNANDEEQKQTEHQTELPPSISSGDRIASADEYQKIIDSSNVTDHVKSLATTDISNVTNALPTSTSIEQASTINEMTVTDSEVQFPIVTDGEIETKEVDNQQQSSSTGLFEIVKNLFPSTLQSNTPIETSLESVPSEQEDNIESSVDNFNLSSTDTNQQTSLQASITDEKESHGVFDLVASAISNIKETISNLGSSDEKTAISTSVPDVVNDRAPSYQKRQAIGDNYPWYSSYYSIVDAEARFAQSCKQLDLSNEQSPPLTKVEVQSGTTQNNELQDKEDTDENGFHIVQHRKRIPSSTTHEKTVSSTVITSKPVVSPDIDLEPVILHGHPSAPLPVSPIVPQTTDTTTKKKQKKKKKDKKEMILFNAPEPTLSHVSEPTVELTQSQTVEEQQGQENIEMNDTVNIDQALKHEEEQLQPIPAVISDDQKSEIVFTSMTSNIEELKQIDDEKNELTPSDTSSLLSTRVATLPEDIQINTQLIEQQPTEEESIILTSSIQTNVTPSSKKEEDEEDNEGFQLVRYRGRILSTTKSDQTSLSAPISNELLSPDLDQKTPIPHEHQSSPTSKKKRNKHKKQKKEIDASANIDSNKIEQEPVEQETILQSYIRSPSTLEDSNVQTHLSPPSTAPMTKIHSKPTALSEDEEEEEEEEDNEGFQVVTYRKRITSAPRFVNTPPSPLTKTRYERNVKRNIDHRRVVLHGRHGSASPSIPRTNVITKTPSKQKSLIHTPPRSVSAETQNVTSTGTSNIFRTPKDIKQTPVEHHQRIKDLKREPIVDLKPKLDQSSPKEPSAEQIVEEHHMLVKEEIKTSDQRLSVEETVSSAPLITNSTEAEKSTSIGEKNDSLASTTAPESVISQGATRKKKLKKPKTNKDDIRSPLTTDRDSIPLSVEETTDQKVNDDIQQVSELQITPADNSLNSEEIPLINTASETITSPIIEPVNQTHDAQSSLHSIQSIASSTSAVEEISKASNDPSITNPTGKEESTKEILPTTSIEPITHIEDEQVKTTSTKKPAKRRKKKLHTKEKSDDENVITSSASAATATSSQIESTIPPSNATETTMTSSFSSLSNTSEIVSKDVIDKLDLFLPAYIREQLDTPQISPSSSSTSTITSFDTIQKKKPRSKMLKKDHEAKSLLTNEFDNTLHTEKQVVQQIDDNHIDDDDVFIVQSVHSSLPNESLNNNSTEETFDNILSRGFYLWLQESQAISQQQDNRTPIMQSIVIQPATTTDEDEDEDSWNALPIINSTYMTGIHPRKQIHITNAYSINHPESVSTPSWLIAQSNENTFQDKPEQFDSDNEDQDKSKKQTDTQSNSNNYQATNDKLGKNFYRQNHSINFDDWAHFLEDKTSYHIGHDLLPSLECFYTRTLDDDTLLSDAIPIDHSIENQQQRYGDFVPPDNDELTIRIPLHKTKPSEYFRKSISKKQHENDDEILISHSNDGLSRRVDL